MYYKLNIFLKMKKTLFTDVIFKEIYYNILKIYSSLLDASLSYRLI